MASRELDIVNFRPIGKGIACSIGRLSLHAIENYLERLIEKAIMLPSEEQVGEQLPRGIFPRKASAW